jgi:hypothetical protein
MDRRVHHRIRDRCQVCQFPPTDPDHGVSVPGRHRVFPVARLTGIGRRDGDNQHTGTFSRGC